MLTDAGSTLHWYLSLF